MALASAPNMQCAAKINLKVLWLQSMYVYVSCFIFFAGHNLRKEPLPHAPTLFALLKSVIFNCQGHFGSPQVSKTPNPILRLEGSPRHRILGFEIPTCFVWICKLWNDDAKICFGALPSSPWWAGDGAVEETCLRTSQLCKEGRSYSIILQCLPKNALWHDSTCPFQQFSSLFIPFPFLSNCSYNH